MKYLNDKRDTNFLTSSHQKTTNTMVPSVLLAVPALLMNVLGDCNITRPCSKDWNCGSAPISVLTDTRGYSGCNNITGQCVCDADGYDPNSCLPDNNGCTMCQASISNSDLTNYPGYIASGSFYYCFNEMNNNQYNYHSMQNEIRAIGVYEGSSDHTQSATITLDLKTCSSDSDVSTPLILLLSSYEAVDWIITSNDQNIVNNLQINTIQALSYKHQTTTVTVLDGINVVDGAEVLYPHSSAWESGYGYGPGRTAKMIYRAPSILGDYIYSFIGTYQATNIEVCVGDQNRPTQPYTGLINIPTISPTYAPSDNPTGPSLSPTTIPTIIPTDLPTEDPTKVTGAPSVSSLAPSSTPSESPSFAPSSPSIATAPIADGRVNDAMTNINITLLVSTNNVNITEIEQYIIDTLTNTLSANNNGVNVLELDIVTKENKDGSLDIIVMIDALDSDDMDQKDIEKDVQDGFNGQDSEINVRVIPSVQTTMGFEDEKSDSGIFDFQNETMTYLLLGIIALLVIFIFCILFWVRHKLKKKKETDEIDMDIQLGRIASVSSNMSMDTNASPQSLPSMAALPGTTIIGEGNVIEKEAMNIVWNKQTTTSMNADAMVMAGIVSDGNDNKETGTDDYEAMYDTQIMTPKGDLDENRNFDGVKEGYGILGHKSTNSESMYNTGDVNNDDAFPTQGVSPRGNNLSMFQE